MSAAIDRGEVYALLAVDGPRTATEVVTAMKADGTWWHYGRAWYALQGLERRGWVGAAGAGPGQPVLWFVPVTSGVPR